VAAPPRLKEEEKVQKEPPSLWEETRREVRGIPAPKPEAKGAREAPAQEYDAKKVDKLKQTLLETLKHATNIRNLKPEESIAVAVLGYEKKSGELLTASTLAVRDIGQVIDFEIQIEDDPVTGMGRLVTTPRFKPLQSLPQAGEAGRTVLTIHVKKADVDAFAKGELTLEQFGERAAILAYCGEGGSPEASDADQLLERLRRRREQDSG